MEGSRPTSLLTKAVVSLGAAAVLALVAQRLLRQQPRQGSDAPQSQQTAKDTPNAPLTSAAPAQAANASGGLTGLEAQRAAALGAADRPWAPDFDLPMEKDIERRLRARYNPTYLDIENQGGNCGALKVAVVMVSEAFRGQSKINRQREVQSVLRPDLDSGRLHALSLMLKTPEEHEKILAKQKN
eukprot:TRINITY_DN50227_c0_g1_i1.p1 TRINITY_DN50227_c0_g1~~TRINITY_DN50227_c0_g1_i1.p1  ORF type:complete len:185 (+),score=35.75 TRINITY_DN50227_c0_g1_i1:51-605(+)